jgi:hypothetical protein
MLLCFFALLPLWLPGRDVETMVLHSPTNRTAIEASLVTAGNSAPATLNLAASLAELPDSTNIHHQVRYCTLCHENGAQGPIASQVRFGTDFRAGCRCHYNNPGDLRHPSDVPLPPSMHLKDPSSFPRVEGRITCVTCHSFAVLCTPVDSQKSSLRGAPYPDRSAFCFRCHDEQQYARVNPHNQLDSAKHIIAEKCLFCHTQKPDETSATYASVKVIGGVQMLCQGCHNVGDQHPANKPHLVKPPLEYQVRMRALEREYGIVLPLDENGKLTCITCHNPHDAGVISRALPGSKGAGETLRHRLPKNLCAECHWHALPTPGR